MVRTSSVGNEERQERVGRVAGREQVGGVVVWGDRDRKVGQGEEWGEEEWGPQWIKPMEQKLTGKFGGIGPLEMDWAFPLLHVSMVSFPLTDSPASPLI